MYKANKSSVGDSVELEVNVTALKDCRLTIATPMYGGVCSGIYHCSMLDLFALAGAYSLNFRHEYIYNDALITRARNELVHRFMESDSEYLLFIDGDIGFRPEDVLYTLQEIKKGEKHIIVGTYPKKIIDWDAIYATGNKNGVKTKNDYIDVSVSYVVNYDTKLTRPKVDFTKPVKVLDAGTGFMMISRTAFEEFAKNYTEQRFVEHNASKNKIKKIAYFDCEIDKEDGVYLSEDYFFTRKMKKIGYDTWLLPWIQLRHAGTHIFEGNYINKHESERKRFM